jgi:hypothetical protein
MTRILLREKKKLQRKSLPYQLIQSPAGIATINCNFFIKKDNCLFNINIAFNWFIHHLKDVVMSAIMCLGGKTASFAHVYGQGTLWDIMLNILDRTLLFNCYKLMGYRCYFV